MVGSFRPVSYHAPVQSSFHTASGHRLPSSRDRTSFGSAFRFQIKTFDQHRRLALRPIAPTIFATCRMLWVASNRNRQKKLIQQRPLVMKNSRTGPQFHRSRIAPFVPVRDSCNRRSKRRIISVGSAIVNDVTRITSTRGRVPDQ